MANNSVNNVKLEYMYMKFKSLKDVLDSSCAKEFILNKQQENEKIYKEMLKAARNQDFEAFKKAYERLK